MEYTKDKTEGRVNIDWLNVRNGMDTDAKIVGVLEKGSKVIILKRINEYFAINYGIDKGYINTKYVDVIG